MFKNKRLITTPVIDKIITDTFLLCIEFGGDDSFKFFEIKNKGIETENSIIELHDYLREHNGTIEQGNTLFGKLQFNFPINNLSMSDKKYYIENMQIMYYDQKGKEYKININ